LGAAALEQLKTRTADYFNQVETFSQALASLTAQLPNMLPSDHEALDAFVQATGPANRDISFLLLFVCDQLVMDICVNKVDRAFQAESAAAKVRLYLREKADVQFEEAFLEIFPVGGGQIVYREGRFFVTGHNESFEFTFSEPDQAMSNYLLSRLACIKFSFVAQILRKEFPHLRFVVQV
jgi:hypothetical protein